MNRARYLWQLAWLVAFVVLWVDEERHLIPGYDVVGAVVAGTEISVALFFGVMSVVLLVGYAFYGLALAVTYAVKIGAELARQQRPSLDGWPPKQRCPR